MKKLFLFVLVATAISFNACSKDDGETWTDDSPIIEFKDPNFLQALLNHPTEVRDPSNIKIGEIDQNHDNYISEKEAYRIIALNFSDYDNIRNAGEIHYFTSLLYLQFFGNQLTTLDVSKNIELKDLDCTNNQITSLIIGNNNQLNGLSCSRNQLLTLDISKNTNLTSLYCSENKLTKLDVSKNMGMKELNCNDNKLTNLNVSKNTSLTELYCANNELTTLNTSKCSMLTNLSCQNNKLESLILDNPNLGSLICTGNQLMSLDLSKCPKLNYIDCKNNPNLKSIIIYKYHVIKQEYIDKIIEEYGDIITYVD